MKIAMSFTRRHLLLAVAVLSLVASGQFLRGQTAEKPYVILVSIDGFRFDYAEHFKTRNILAIRDNGAAAASMIPVFPSVTFPNHISITTGLYPEHHGFVGNSFFDPLRGAEYNMRTTSTDGSWYQKGTPLWVLGEQQHMVTACMFWPTCDGEIQGTRPTYWRKFDGSFSDENRVNQVLDWLKFPAEKRPHFITLHFEEVDAAGHQFGPESLETAVAALQVDRMIGKLREGLDKLTTPVNLILVSDHGMQDVQDGLVGLSEYVDRSRVHIEEDGPVAFIYCRDAETIEKTYLRMKKNSKLEVFKRAETPTSWHLNENPRAGDLIAVVKGAAVFTLIDLGVLPKDPRPPMGDHGYDPQKFPTMRAIFYAIGPNIRPGTKIPSFENVSVYPFIARILGLNVPANLDGSAAVLDPAYRP